VIAMAIAEVVLAANAVVLSLVLVLVARSV
jgi:hypothetical protein